MASQKISQMPAISSFATGDLLPIVDISEFLPSDKNKSVTFGELFRNVLAGSASAPSIAFTGDQNTGIYSPGADQLALSTNGTGRLFVDASGNVGVGTANPEALVHLRATSPFIRFTDSVDATHYAHIGYSDVSIYVIDADAGNTKAGSAIQFKVDNAERLRITSDGKLGLGTSSPGASFSVAGGSAYVVGNSGIATNGIDVYATAGGNGLFGGAISFGVGGIGHAAIAGVQGSSDTDVVGLSFFTHESATGSADAVERMRITSGGNVGIGTTSPSASLSCYHATNNTIATFQSGDSVARATFIDPSGQAHVGAEGDNLVFAVTSSATERARIDSSGRLLVGTSSAQAYVSGGTQAKGIQIAGSSGETTAYTAVRYGNDIPGSFLSFSKSRGASIGTQGIVSNGDQLGFLAFHGSDGSNFIRAASITAEVDGTPGANDMPGRLVFSTTADGASSPTERMRIGSNGTVLIGKTTAGIGNAGIELSSAGQDAKFTTFGATPVFVNRLATDGVLIDLQQASTTEGTISVSGTTVSYNGAHLSRWSQLVGIDPYDKTARPEILRGTVMSNLDEMCDWTCPISGDCQDNEQLNKTKISSVDGDPNVAGVFQSWDDDDDTWVNDFYLAMTGDFVIRIAAGTTVQRGDLLCSAGDGTARPQGDRYLKDSTIAKVTSTAVSCTHPDGSYCVPCVLMAC